MKYMCSKCLVKMVCEEPCYDFELFAGERGYAKPLNPCTQIEDHTWSFKSP